MSIKDKTVTLRQGEQAGKLFHRTAAKRFSVELRPGQPGVELRRNTNGGFSGRFQRTAFTFLTLGQTIPTGAVFGRLDLNPAEPLEVEVAFRVRSGANFTGVPEFDT